MPSIHDILRPVTLTKVISRIASTTDTLLQFMGMQPGGANEIYMGHGREGSYHVFNHTRQVAQGRAPGTAAGTAPRNPVGRVPFVYPRMHEQISLPAEELHNLAKIDDVRMRDEAGADYIRRQGGFLGEKAGNWRTAMVVGMLRDSLYVHNDGDNWYPSYTSSGSLYQINYQMPAGNKSKLNMLGAGDIIDVSWDNAASSNIPLHLGKINAAFQQLYGGRLTDVIVPVAVWMNVIQNEYVAAVHGSATAPFQMFERAAGTGPDGTPINEHLGRLSVMPGVTWHITDAGCELGAPGSEAYAKHVPDTGAIFLPSPTGATSPFSLYQGSEPIAEYDGGPETVRIGFSAWSKKSSNPTATELFVLDNALPVNHIPASTAFGTVIY